MPSSASVYLALMVIVRNECPSFTEWLRHHRNQGVERFYVIDNGSEPPPCAALVEAPDVTLLHWAHRPSANRSYGNQADAYNHFLPRVKAEWLALWDVDEFGFGVNRSLSDALRTLPSGVAQLCMPWLYFGSRFILAMTLLWQQTQHSKEDVHGMI